MAKVRIYGAKSNGRRYSYMTREVFGRVQFSATSAGTPIWRKTRTEARIAAQDAGTFRFDDDPPLVLRDGETPEVAT